ncbi:MAG: hypothetical protein J0I84_05125 [Terrimonas sp.]|nr:hypothetical protein [Terrimonas sp.]
MPTLITIYRRIFNPVAQDGSYYHKGRTGVSVKKENGWYIRLISNNRELAKASLDRILLKDADLYDTTHSNWKNLYGRYNNTPLLYNAQDSLIPPTMSNERYHLFSLQRSGETDTSWWGPIIEKPSRLVFVCAQLDSTRHPSAKVVY